MRGSRFLTLKGRLKPGVTMKQAQAELDVIAGALQREYPDTNKDHALVAQTELEIRFARHPLDSGPLVLLSTLSTAVLCVACANVAGLLASRAPVRARELASVVPEGYVLPDGVTSVRPNLNVVDEHYFETLEIPIVAGRAFRATDTPDVARVAIVNETFAQHYWPGAGAVGRRFRLFGARGPLVEIVGVARNSTYVYFREPPQAMIYFPFRQDPRRGMVLLAQTEGDSAAALDPLREALGSLEPDVAVYDVQTMETFYAARVTSIVEVILSLIGGIGLMGMTLTMVGLYGLVSYAVSRRTREIGIRMAVGASDSRVLRMILWQGMVPAWCGLAIGLALSVIAMRMLPTIVPIDDRFDPRSFLLVVPMLVAVTLIAAGVPARRAARVNPTVALRCE